MSQISRGLLISRWIPILISCCGMVVAFLPIGTDSSRQAWLDGGLLIAGGLILLLCATGSRYQAGLSSMEAIIAPVLMAAGVALSAVVADKYAGGDAFHLHLGFPFRWIIGSQSGTTAGAPIEWSLFWPGLLVDGTWWLILGLCGLMLVGQVLHWYRLGGRSSSGTARQARG